MRRELVRPITALASVASIPRRRRGMDNRTEAQQLIGVYLDAVSELGSPRPTKRFVGQMSKAIKSVMDEGQSYDLVAAALRRLALYGSPPKELDAALVKAARANNGLGAIQKFMGENGGKWPTGVRRIRGTHGTQEVYDPLGYERAPDGWTFAKPSADEVRAALKARPPKPKVEPRPKPEPEPEPVLEDRRRDVATLLHRISTGRSLAGLSSLPE